MGLEEPGKIIKVEPIRRTVPQPEPIREPEKTFPAPPPAKEPKKVPEKV